MVTASPWRRFFATIIDTWLVTPLFLVITALLLHGISFFLASYKDFFETIVGFFYIIISLFYNPIFESSRLQSTIGQYLMKIKITSLTQERISFGRALIRWSSQLISAFFFMIAIILFALVVCFCVGVICFLTKQAIGNLPEYFLQTHPILYILIALLGIFALFSLAFCFSFVRLCSKKTQTIQDYFSSTYMLLREKHINM